MTGTDLRQMSRWWPEWHGMLKMNLCRWYSVLNLIHFHWKLTRFPLSPAVLLLTGLSRSDWNLVNLNRSDCCGIPIVLLWGLFFLKKDKKNPSNTGADFDYYLCALKTILFCSSELRTVRYFWLFILRPFFKVLPAWAETVMENGGFFVQGFCFFNVRLQVSWLQLPNSPHSHVNSIKPLLPFLFFYQVKCSYDNTEMLCLLNCIYIYIYLLHLCAFFTTKDCPKKDINVAQMISFFCLFLFDPSLQWKICASEILATFKMSIVNIYLFTERESQGHDVLFGRCVQQN